MNGGKDMKHKIEIIYSRTPPETFFMTVLEQTF